MHKVYIVFKHGGWWIQDSYLLHEFTFNWIVENLKLWRFVIIPMTWSQRCLIMWLGRSCDQLERDGGDHQALVAIESWGAFVDVKQHVKQALSVNGYEKWSFNLPPKKDKKDSSDNTSNTNKRSFPVALPYIKGTSEVIQRVFKQHGVRTYHQAVYSLRTKTAITHSTCRVYAQRLHKMEGDQKIELGLLELPHLSYR